MNLETISSPGGETGAACSLSSLLTLGCRSRAEAAHGFAKKLHTKLWSLTPLTTTAATDELSSNQTRHPCEAKEVNSASTWGVAVEARFDVNSKRVETVVTSLPSFTPNQSRNSSPTTTSTIVYQPAGCQPDKTSFDQLESTAATDMESKNGTKQPQEHYHNLNASNIWTHYSKNQNGQSSSIRGADQESDTSSTTTTNPMSDSDQYFDFGIETPLDLDSAGEETVSHDNIGIVINRDDGLPVQPEGMESGCIFGSPVLSDDGDSDDGQDDHEEEPSFYESLSQSPANAALKGNLDRFHFAGNNCGDDQVSQLAENSTETVNITNGLDEPSRMVQHGEALMPLAGDSADKALAQSAGDTEQLRHVAPSADYTPANLHFQGDLEDKASLFVSDEFATGPSPSEIVQFSPAGPAHNSSASGEIQLEQEEDDRSQVESGEDVNPLSDVLTQPSTSSDMVRLDSVIVDRLFHANAPAEDSHPPDRVNNLQLDLVKYTEDRFADEDGVSHPEESNPGVIDKSSGDAEKVCESNGEETQSTGGDTSSTKESTPSVNEDEQTDEEDDSSQPNRHRVQRSTSLKTGKTPPGTPGRKKIVRFADALGLDLALVRTFLDEVPNVPQSAFNDLSDVSTDEEAGLPRSNPSQSGGTYIRITRRDPNTNSSVTTFVNSPRILVASFTQPGNMPDFLEKVKRQKVCLETACMMDESKLRGVVRVLNIDFHKSVLIRYTTDEWRTQGDQLAAYVPDSCDGLSDRFTFTIAGAQSMQPGQRLMFALCYRVAGQEIWDSNQGRNYVFQCISNTNYLPSIALSSPTVSDTFLPYF